MKRLIMVLASAALALAGLTATTNNAVAEENVSAALVNCNHYSGGGITPRSANYISVFGDGAHVGAAQLCKTGSTYWGYAVVYSQMPATSWGQAYIYQYRNGTQISSASCDTPPQGAPSGGNGHIAPTQTQCWTHKFSAGAGDTFKVCGTVYFGQFPDRTNQDAWGCTATVS